MVAFCKMHGAGNDYVFVECLDSLPVPAGLLPELARRISDRHEGVGSDGLILVLPSPAAEAEFGFRMFNRDGSEGQMCGNGMRCFARYVVSRGLVAKLRFAVATPAGLIDCQVTPDAEDRAWQVTCDLGPPRLLAAEVPTKLATDATGRVVLAPIQVLGHELRLTAVNTGVPHAVAFVAEPDDLPWRELGRRLERHEAFAEGTNVDFARIDAPDRVFVRVWERGSGETMACGTGACAVVVAGAMIGRLERRATVKLGGGELTVDWRPADDHLLLTGPAVEICRGEFVTGPF